MAATAKITSFPSAVQATPVTQITQAELGLLVSLRNRLTQIQEQIAEAEDSVKARLETGAAVEVGLLRAFLKTVERRSVSWKSVVERELGADYAKRVLAATKPDTFTHLVVTA